MPYYYRLKHTYGPQIPQIVERKKRTARNLIKLRNALQAHIEGEDNNLDEHLDVSDKKIIDSKKFLRLATWNIREFDSGKFGSRLDESYYYIAEIMANFDLIAVQEVNDDLYALERVMGLLGSEWKYIATDVTQGSAGNNERMVFVFNSSKVWFNDIAGELSIPKGDKIAFPHEERIQFEDELEIKLPPGTKLSVGEVKLRKRKEKRFLKEELLIDLPEGASIDLPVGTKIVLPRGMEVDHDDGVIKIPKGQTPVFKPDDKGRKPMLKLPDGLIVGDKLQFARTPFIVSFQCGWLKLNLCTVHIYYGEGHEGLARRRDEIESLTKLLSNRAERDWEFNPGSFMIALGDFNIIDQNHETMKALNSNHFKVPEKLQELPGTNIDKTKAYDQIAYWQDEKVIEKSEQVTRLEVQRAGVFDFFETVFKEGDIYDPDGEEEAFYRSDEDYKDSWVYKDWRTHQMSDHLPMWVELKIDFGDEYLEDIAAD